MKGQFHSSIRSFYSQTLSVLSRPSYWKNAKYSIVAIRKNETVQKQANLQINGSTVEGLLHVMSLSFYSHALS
jgi:hypothetical protein